MDGDGRRGESSACRPLIALTPRCMVCCGMTVTVLLALFFEESYVPAILARQAKLKRDQTGDWAWHSAVDRVKITPSDIVVRYLLRPLRMMFTEPSKPCTASLCRQR